jgi:hypothetical protein
MKQNMNYINALPDFLAMQRISFCWFITQGLNEELAYFLEFMILVKILNILCLEKNII